jgi:branched-chain amino acid transport system permease protein
MGPLPFLLAIALVAVMPWLGANSLLMQLTELVMFFAMLTSGLNLTFGYAGEFAFTQPALYALGAYVGGYMALHGVNNILLTVIASTAAAGVAGLVLGIPALRLGGWSTAMVSFLIILTLPDIENLFQAQTGGTSGLAGIPLPRLFGATLTNGEYFVICVALAAIVVLLSRNLICSRHGRAFLVLRESPVLAQSLGVNVYRMKVELYVLGGMSAGAAGALFAYLYG